MLVLSCPSGIAGNLWMSALLGLGADSGVLDGLPARLGVPEASIHWRFDPATRRSEVHVDGTSAAQSTDFDGLLERVRRAGLPPAVRDDALAVLHRRERAEAALLATDLAARRFSGDDVADTLIDVTAGVALWHELGRPVTTTDGPVVAGVHPRRSSLELLGATPVARAAPTCVSPPRPGPPCSARSGVLRRYTALPCAPWRSRGTSASLPGWRRSRLPSTIRSCRLHHSPPRRWAPPGARPGATQDGD